MTIWAIPQPPGTSATTAISAPLSLPIPLAIIRTHSPSVSICTWFQNTTKIFSDQKLFLQQRKQAKPQPPPPKKPPQQLTKNQKPHHQKTTPGRWFSSQVGHWIPNTGRSVMFLLYRGTNPTQSSCIYAQVCFKTRTHMPNNVIAKYKVIWFSLFLNILMQMWNKFSTLSLT